MCNPNSGACKYFGYGGNVLNNLPNDYYKFKLVLCKKIIHLFTSNMFTAEELSVHWTWMSRAVHPRWVTCEVQRGFNLKEENQQGL